MIVYEWTFEEIPDRESGDITDSHFADELHHLIPYLDGPPRSPDGDLGLVYNKMTNEQVEMRLWAYVKDNKLPEFFSDSRKRVTDIKVPQKYHDELKDSEGYR